MSGQGQEPVEQHVMGWSGWPDDVVTTLLAWNVEYLHAWRIAADPRPRQYKPNGRPILRIAPRECARCGRVEVEW